MRLNCIANVIKKVRTTPLQLLFLDYIFIGIAKINSVKSALVA
ncbi:hypothetical protein HMPREF0669_01963 (plasmid) [Prevotella sp. oral taxon 299 str. F0039]|nr:hypothetical protein HMPREF0669_01963 [Prevotella sp. oral taxon 299 str. F0039]